MRKYLFIFTVFLFILGFNLGCQNGLILSAATEPLFYKITQDEVFLYSITETREASSEVICSLPKTYFVKAIDSLDDTHLEVSYLGVSGTVNKSAVTPVYSTPTTPYSVQTFDLLHTANATVWQKPSTTSTYLSSIPYDATDTLYIGSVSGQKLNDHDLGIWYLCKYVDSEKGPVLGYLHSSLVSNLSPLIENTEEVQLEPDAAASTTILAPELGNTNNLLLILLLTIPAAIILILIIKPKRTKKQSARRQIKALNQLSLPDKNDRNDFDF